MCKPLPSVVARRPKGQKHPLQPLQAPGRTYPEQPTHHDAQIVRGHLHQVALRDLDYAPQPTTPGTTRLADMRETPLHSFTPQALQALAAAAPHPPPISTVRLLLRRRFVRPG